jgi:hypothetical protein
LYEFHGAMRKYIAHDQPLFDWEKGESVTYHQAQGSIVQWSFTLELKRTEAL